MYITKQRLERMEKKEEGYCGGDSGKSSFIVMREGIKRVEKIRESFAQKQRED